MRAGRWKDFVAPEGL